jgi:integral membrane protein (TIGR00529 family)
METMFNIPVIIKIVIIFILILILVRRKYSLGTALLGGALLLGFWCRMNFLQIAKSIGATIIQPQTILLNAIVVLILILSHAMQQLGQMKRLLSSFRGLVKNAKLNLIAFPAIIGLLPMPGGAIFSAPMVDVLGKEHDLDPETKSLINYWFRHVWETAWPLYPGVLLAASLASVSVWRFAGIASPILILTNLAGYLFLLRKIAWKPSPDPENVPAAQLRSFLKEMIPIMLVIGGAVIGSTIMAWLQHWLPMLASLPTELPLVVALVASITVMLRMNHAPVNMLATICMNRAFWELAYMVTAIYIFKGILVDSHAVVDISQSLTALNIPLLLVLIILPALVGAITGVTAAFVGTTFPVLISLLQTAHPANSLIPYLILAYVSGYIGLMSSPIHVCFILNREYFQSDFRLLYRQLWKPLAALFAGALLYFVVLIALGI